MVIVKLVQNLRMDMKYQANVVIKDVLDRQSILDWEKDNAQRLWDEGNSMNKHLRPRPWEN
jgi:hypothetical protein